MDTEGRLTLMNPKAENYWQWTQEECVIKTFMTSFILVKNGNPFINEGCPNENPIEKGGIYQNREDWIHEKKWQFIPGFLCN